MSHPVYQTVLLFGAPGAGKGTQGRVLGTIPGFYHLSCGDVFRALDIGSEIGKQVYEYSSRGELVPDDLTIRIWERGLEGQIALNKYKPHQDLLILDGIPRNVPQAQLLDEHVKVVSVLHLVCTDEETMIHRIKRRAIKENRADDAKESVIRRRFEVYHEETAPLLAHYDTSLISEIDAIGSPAQVLHRALEHLIPIQNQVFAS